MSYYALLREWFRYHILKVGLWAMYMNVKIRSAFGMQVDSEELKDFELDVVEGDDVDRLGKMDDSKTFEELDLEAKSSTLSLASLNTGGK